MKHKEPPVRTTMCPTCPFRPGSKYGYLAEDLAISSANTSRVCHSTGSSNAINTRTGFPPHICRGSRDIQLEVMNAAGVIDAATDDAWNRKRVAIGLPEQAVQDPIRRKPEQRRK